MAHNVVTLASRRNDKIDPVVLDWASKAPQEFLECRDAMHNIVSPKKGVALYLLWEVHRINGAREWRRTVVCARCGTKRIDRKDFLTGERLNAYYEPPEAKPGRSDYYLPPGNGRLDRGELFRLTLAMGEAERKSAKPAAKRRRSPQKKGA